MNKHSVKLTPKERKRLLSIVNKGRNKAAVIRRAHILLKSDEGKADKTISALLYISEHTVRNTRLRFVEDGLAASLEDRAHPKPAPKLDEHQTAYLVAVACSEPPDGRGRWTLELLSKRLVADGIIDSIAPETVRLTLKKTD